MSTILGLFPKEITVEKEKLSFTSKLGQGDYGMVFLYQNDKKQVALKIANDKSSQSAMYRESYYLKKLHIAKLIHTPTYYGEGIHNGQVFVLHEHVENSIEEFAQQFKDEDQRRIKLIEIGLQMIEALRELHEAGYLLQDIKPENIGVTKDGLVKILHFGIINEYKPGDRHKSLGRYGFQGTPYFGSIRAHEGYTLSRRDDLEFIGYMMMHLLYPELVPWRYCSNLRDILKTKLDLIKNYPEEIEDGGRLRPLFKFAALAYSLEYEEDPDYQQFAHILLGCQNSIPSLVFLEQMPEKLLQLVIQELVNETCKSHQEMVELQVAQNIIDKILRQIMDNFLNEKIYQGIDYFQKNCIEQEKYQYTQVREMRIREERLKYSLIEDNQKLKEDKERAQNELRLLDVAKSKLQRIVDQLVEQQYKLLAKNKERISMIEHNGQLEQTIRQSRFDYESKQDELQRQIAALQGQLRDEESKYQHLLEQKQEQQYIINALKNKGFTEVQKQSDQGGGLKEIEQKKVQICKELYALESRLIDQKQIHYSLQRDIKTFTRQLNELKESYAKRQKHLLNLMMNIEQQNFKEKLILKSALACQINNWCSKKQPLLKFLIFHHQQLVATKYMEWMIRSSNQVVELAKLEAEFQSLRNLFNQHFKQFTTNLNSQSKDQNREAKNFKESLRMSIGTLPSQVALKM
ncbi:hypothetical protein FGO68_gene7883 [Halteria grandinella]|uniref:Casein kinase I n=1 Tax=Halteria grandinella TaxID=5974 RepID=A0A8J8P184_HALGN|nr:hypothetical protein FGO68_gene7883 [Halteria grandinella]